MFFIVLVNPILFTGIISSRFCSAFPKVTLLSWLVSSHLCAVLVLSLPHIDPFLSCRLVSHLFVINITLLCISFLRVSSVQRLSIAYLLSPLCILYDLIFSSLISSLVGHATHMYSYLEIFFFLL